jgi:V8-like Glu-specific endopeptidase
LGYSTSTFPYNTVVLIESPDPDNPSLINVGSGVVIGPHTVLTASHVVYDLEDQTADQNIHLYPGWSGADPSLGSGFISTSYTDHYYSIPSTSGLTKAQSAQDFAIIDTSYTFTSWMGVVTDWQGGAAHMTGYPVSAGGAQTDQVGTIYADPSYSVLDYGTLSSSPGNSGGPIWLNYDGSDDVAGIVSTSGWASQLTAADFTQIESWVAQDGYSLTASNVPGPTAASTPPVPDVGYTKNSTLNDFSWAQGWTSPDYLREVVATTNDGASDYVGFGYDYVTMALGGIAQNLSSSFQPIHDFGSAEGYTATAQRGAADTSSGAIAPTVYGQGYAGVYWYDATAGTMNNPTYQSSPNLYPDFGTHEGWTPSNGFDVVKASSTDAYASILGFGDAGIVVGPQAFNLNGPPSSSYVIPFAVGNNSGWDQTVDVRSFVDNNGQAIDLNGDGITDFVGMGPNGLEFAYGSESGGQYSLGPLQSAQISGTSSGFGQPTGWTDSDSVRDIIKDPSSGYYDIIGFGSAGVYVAMGQDPATHSGQPFGQKYLAMADFGTDQGWSNALTPRLVGDVSGDGVLDIVGFGANSTFTALGSYNSNGQLIFTMDPAATINDYGFNEGWSESNTVRALANVDGSGSDSLVVSGAFNTETLKFG